MEDDGRGRRWRRGGEGVPATLREGALELVRVLVAAQRLGAVELAVAVVAREGLPRRWSPVTAPGAGTAAERWSGDGSRHRSRLTP
ncbi:unnamed protein product [Miscanthus lutarioriparius]|uniref:Uncharacterized protein n=1 Tax=Miscanthus lutarioriparius TaxID=422564 RepID=A0A811NES5_9POAL|nr:unnamed protein product [Miscanthus lutarioriparius]